MHKKFYWFFFIVILFHWNLYYFNQGSVIILPLNVNEEVMD